MKKIDHNSNAIDYNITEEMKRRPGWNRDEAMKAKALIEKLLVINIGKTKQRMSTKELIKDKWLCEWAYK